MKILMIAIPNHHFFQWVNQLEFSGYEVHWFDITDGGKEVSKIKWVKQFKGWKLRFDYPFRYRLKKKLPLVFNFIEKINNRDVEKVFSKILNKIQPDIVHCFEMKLTGLPIVSVMNKYKNIKFIYSSWGSDMYYYKNYDVSQNHVELFLARVDFLITDCKRDYNIAIQKGYKNKYLGVFPGNGGIYIDTKFIQPLTNRNYILIKGYNDGIGMASKVLKALELLSRNDLQAKKIIIYSTDNSILSQISESNYLTSLNIKIYRRDEFMPNEELLRIMGNCAIHIANSISDGMPNSLLESMGMGVFPIQSNPGKVSEEVITHGVNGFLIENPLDSTEIANWIKKAIEDNELRENAQKYNIDFVNKNYNRAFLKNEIVQLYNSVLLS